jgi:hypothetical protein
VVTKPSEIRPTKTRSPPSFNQIVDVQASLDGLHPCHKTMPPFRLAYARNLAATLSIYILRISRCSGKGSKSLYLTGMLIFGGTVAIGIVFGIMFSPRPFQGLLET